MKGKKALIMVDLQNDFCKGGHLAVPGGDEVIAIANELQTHFDLVVATQDWHPHDHMSFAENHPGYSVGDVTTVDGLKQVLWPNHCEQDTNGASFHPELKTEHITKIFHKGVDKKIDSYSAFFDNAHRRSTGLGEYLQAENIQDVYVMGLATDYCVKYTSLDALHLKFAVYVIEDACRGVELNTGDIVKAKQEMLAAGAHLIHSSEILKGTS